MKIAFFLGSFDPPHVGHMHVINRALNEVDIVAVVPTIQNPWKENSTDFELRSKMLEDMVEPFGMSVLIQEVEKELEAPYYSYKTLEKLKDIYKNHELYLICGNDVYGEMHNWKNSEWIFQNFNMLPISRNIINISSTTIRNLVKEGKEIYPYVSKGVRSIIKENNLYKI